jgi:DNA modification methylase
MLAFALRADGWYLRQDIIWSKPNQMPESVTDRCTKSHEYIFLLSKQPVYYYDHEAIKDPAVNGDPNSPRGSKGTSRPNGGTRHKELRTGLEPIQRVNKRSVWRVATKGFKNAHFAVFPPELILPCVLAGSRVGGLVIDPFCGSGTTGFVALGNNRRFIGIDLNPEYCTIAGNRLGLFGVMELPC